MGAVDISRGLGLPETFEFAAGKAEVFSFSLKLLAERGLHLYPGAAADAFKCFSLYHRLRLLFLNKAFILKRSFRNSFRLKGVKFLYGSRGGRRSFRSGRSILALRDLLPQFPLFSFNLLYLADRLGVFIQRGQVAHLFKFFGPGVNFAVLAFKAGFKFLYPRAVFLILHLLGADLFKKEVLLPAGGFQLFLDM